MDFLRRCTIVCDSSYLITDDEKDPLSQTVAQVVGLLANRPEQEQLWALLFVWGGSQHETVAAFAQSFKKITQEFNNEKYKNLESNQQLKYDFHREVRTALLERLSTHNKARIESIIHRGIAKLGKEGYSINDLCKVVRNVILAI